MPIHHNVLGIVLSCVLAVLGSKAAAQFFPIAELKNVPKTYANGNANELSSFLSEAGFAVAKRRGKYWYVGASIYSHPTRELSKSLDNFAGCTAASCSYYWAMRNQDPPMFSSFYAHTYRFAWIVEDNTIVHIEPDHSFWRGNK